MIRLDKKDKFDKIGDVLQKICGYSLIVIIGLVLFIKTGEAEAYGAQAMVIILAISVLYFVTLAYRRNK